MIRGSLVALITPFDNHGAIDWPTLGQLIDHHVTAGSHALVVNGTTGEAPTLSEREQLALVKFTVEHAAGRLPIIAGCGSNNTAHAIHLSQQMAALGAVAGLSVTPYYNKPTQEGLYQHYCAIAKASSLPQILYNVPGRTGCDLFPDTVIRLSQVPGIIGLKEASGDLTRTTPLRQGCGAPFALYSGDDATACEFMRQGGDGVISVTANVAAHEMAMLCQHALSGQTATAEKINQLLMPLHQQLFCEPNPTPVKWVAKTLGLIATDTLRLPLLSLSEAGQQRLAQALATLELKASVHIK
ncbi:MAG: 4-hydroxy-tetrahydrodipicolinate synthase [Aeromonas sp.]